MTDRANIVSAAKAVNENLARVMSSMEGAPDGLVELMNEMAPEVKLIITAILTQAVPGEKLHIDLENRLWEVGGALYTWQDDAHRFINKWRTNARDDADHFSLTLQKLRGSVNKLARLTTPD